MWIVSDSRQRFADAGPDTCAQTAPARLRDLRHRAAMAGQILPPLPVLRSGYPACLQAVRKYSLWVCHNRMQEIGPELWQRCFTDAAGSYRMYVSLHSTSRHRR